MLSLRRAAFVPVVALGTPTARRSVSFRGGPPRDRGTTGLIGVESGVGREAPEEVGDRDSGEDDGA